MIINGNGQIQVCNLLILNTKNFACLNWHVARHLTKKIEISPKKCANLSQKNFRRLATLLIHMIGHYRKKSITTQNYEEFGILCASKSAVKIQK